MGCPLYVHKKHSKGPAHSAVSVGQWNADVSRASGVVSSLLFLSALESQRCHNHWHCPSSHQGRTKRQPLNPIFSPVLLLSCYSCLSMSWSVPYPPPADFSVCFLFFTGLESGNVTLKEPTSEGEIESSSTVILRCLIDGHPR